MQRARRAGVDTAARTLVSAVGVATISVAVLVAGLLGGSGCRSSRAGAPGSADAAGDRSADATGGAGGVTGGADARTDGVADGGPSGGDAPSGADVPPVTDAGAGGAAGADGGAGADGAAGADGGFGAGCNTLATGAPVTVVCAGDGGVAPAPTGGSIVPGTYLLTAVTAYGACAAVDVAQTLQLTATTVETVIDDPVNGLSRANATYVIVGNDMVQTNTCPNTDSRTLGFSVTTSAGVTTLTLISTDSSNTTVGVLTRQ